MSDVDITTLLTAAGIIIAALGVLFTVGTIAAAALIYRQGREHQDAIDKTLEQVKRDFVGFVEASRLELAGHIAETNHRFELIATEARLLVEQLPVESKAVAQRLVDEVEEQARRPVDTPTQIEPSEFDAMVQSNMRDPPFRCPHCRLPTIHADEGVGRTCSNCNRYYTRTSPTDHFYTLVRPPKMSPMRR